MPMALVPFTRVLIVLVIVGILMPTSEQMTSLWDHKRRHGDRIIYPDEFLNHFGYMDDGHGFWMHTRSERRSAIRKYQEYNGLKGSGKINRKTWQLMTKPRCGVPDLGPASEPGGKSRRKRDASRSPKATTLENPMYSKWIVKDITWKPVRYGYMLPYDTQRAIFHETFRRWSAASNIQVRERSYGDAEIDIEFHSREHGDGPGNAFDGRGMLLAHAFPPGDVPMSGDIHFDSDEKWSSGVNRSDTRDLMMSAMHEAGHSLGLRHSKNENDVMYPVYLDYNPDVQLTRGDVKELQKYYGINPQFKMPTSRKRNKKLKGKHKIRVDRNIPRWCRRTHFNDVILGPDDIGYIFSGRYVYRITDDGIMQGYPVHVGHEFHGAPINARAVVYVSENKHTYFFKDTRVWRFTNKTLDSGYPMESKTKFIETPRAALATRDHRGGTMVLMFGTKYMWRWNFHTEEVNGRYHSISSYWINLPKYIDGAVEWKDHYIYFFRRNKYYKVSKHRKVVLPGYPKFKGTAWLGGACGSAPK